MHIAEFRMKLVATVVVTVLPLLGGSTLVGATTVLALAPSGETVATGFANPRGLALLGEHTIAVGEAGHAGPLCLALGQCLGLNGRLTSVRLDDQHRTVLAAGLPSFSGPFGAFGVGGVAAQDQSLYFVVGLNPQSFGDPATTCQGQPEFNSCVDLVTAFVKESGQLDRVQSFRSNQGWQHVANVGHFDFDWVVAHHDLSPNNPEWCQGTPIRSGSFAGRPVAYTLSMRHRTHSTS